MKTYLILASLLITLTVNAGTTAILYLKGTVPYILDISIAPESTATNLDLSQSYTNLLVATLSERSNSLTGYTVTITSANQGKLMNGTAFVPYQLSYGDNNVNLINGEILTWDFTSAAPVNRNIKVTYTGSETLAAGDYTDTVTFTIASN